jgi:NADH dehydrogenase FAD-containing subunit
VAVVGGGYAGVEIATSIAAYLGKNKAVVSIIDRNSKILQTSPQFTREKSERCADSISLNH